MKAAIRKRGLYIAPLPCGCAAERDAMIVHAQQKAIECPWCAAVFDAADLKEWAETAPNLNYRFGHGPFALIRCGLRLLELVDFSRAGIPIVRLHGSHATFHLHAPMKTIEQLFN